MPTGASPLGVIRAGRRADDEEAISVRGVNAQHHIRRDHRRADIQRSARRARHPIRIDLQQRGQTRQRLLHVDLRHAHALGRAIHALKVVARTEEIQTAVLAAIALHAFKDFLRIVEHGAGRIHHKRAIGHHTGIMPAASLFIIHDEHMIGKDLAKAEFGFILRLFFRIGCERHRNVVHGRILHQSSVCRELWGKNASNRSGSIVSPHVHNVKRFRCRILRKCALFCRKSAKSSHLFRHNRAKLECFASYDTISREWTAIKKERFRAPFETLFTPDSP